MATTHSCPAFTNADISTRLIGPSDVDAVRAVYAGLDNRDGYFRFFGAGRFQKPGQLASLICRADSDRAAVGAFAGDRLVGVANYVRNARWSTAEAALAVAHDMQMHGVGSQLLAALIELARSNGVDALEADVLAENLRMLAVLRESGYPITFHSDSGVVRVHIDLTGEAGRLGTFGPEFE